MHTIMCHQYKSPRDSSISKYPKGKWKNQFNRLNGWILLYTKTPWNPKKDWISKIVLGLKGRLRKDESSHGVPLIWSVGNKAHWAPLMQGRPKGRPTPCKNEDSMPSTLIEQRACPWFHWLGQHGISLTHRATIEIYWIGQIWRDQNWLATC